MGGIRCLFACVGRRGWMVEGRKKDVGWDIYAEGGGEFGGVNLKRA